MPISSTSAVPAKIYRTKGRIQTLCIGISDVTKLIKALDVSKGHGHDGISVKMIKNCADSIAYPLALVFQDSLVAGIFANDWKKCNIVPVHKKSDKQIFSNYRPVSLLPKCSKIFENLILMNCLPFLRRETCYLSLVFDLVILAFTSCLHLHMTFFLVLTLVLI